MLHRECGKIGEEHCRDDATEGHTRALSLLSACCVLSHSATMEFYGIFFASLIIFNAALAYHRHQQSSFDKIEEEETLALPKDEVSKQDVKNFKTMYFGVYILVMAADWLQVRTDLDTLERISTYICTGTLHLHPLQRRETPLRGSDSSSLHNRVRRCRNHSFVHGILGRQIWTETSVHDLLRRLLIILPFRSQQRHQYAPRRSGTRRPEHNSAVFRVRDLDDS